MKTMLAVLTTFVLTAALLLHPARVHGQVNVSGVKEFVRVAPQDVKWVPEADGSGIERATIFGDPTKPGIYVVQIKFPRGMMSRPHFHGEDRHATVIKGTWYTGTGDRFAPEETMPIPAGSYMLHPAGEIHYDGAMEEEVIVQLVGYGPSSTTRLSTEGNFAPSLSR